MGHRARARDRACALVVALALAATACNGGGGGAGGRFDAHAQLVAITFPDPSGVNPEAEDEAPRAAPLLQSIVLTFDGRPDPGLVSTSSLGVRDLHGFPAPGSYTVAGNVVTFTPALPTRPVALLGEGSYDTGGTGLAPATAYSIRVGPAAFPFVTSAAAPLQARFPDPTDPRGILVGFTTTGDPAHFLLGLPPVAPALVSVDPEDGTAGVSPGLFRDPDQLFAAASPFRLVFDAPIRPDASNAGDATFSLVDLDDRPAGFPGGLPLGIDIRLAENALDRGVVEIVPSGILPFGHLLALQFGDDIKGISEAGTPAASWQIAAAFTVAAAPSGPVRDTLIEDFDTADRAETDPAEFGLTFPAEWNRDGSGVLQAGFAFQGAGILGRFVPPPPAAGETSVIVLDTSQQVFPLFDGSTPDAPAGFEVRGGVFPFTDIDIPSGVVIKALGNVPLVFTATGSIRIAGEFQLSGGNGTSDHAYDSAVSPVPGGPPIAGGGRGGEGHPILFFPPDQVSALNMVSPPRGGRGFGLDPLDGLMRQIGGIGGQSGMLDHADTSGRLSTDREISCNEVNADNSNGVKPPGGGGGSMLTKGLPPRRPGAGGATIHGIGNVLVDGQGHHLVRPESESVLLAGEGGDAPFFDDGDSQNDFFGTHGQVRRMLGGQGGGGGASRTESYYCGIWCERDTDAANDGVCDGNDFGKSPKFADSVGDARGGGGGAGGGALLVQALGPITLHPTALIRANGGSGGGAEQLGCSSFAGGGAGGAGGSVVFQSGTSLLIEAGARIEVQKGLGDSASDSDLAFDCDEGGNDGAIGDGGDGGIGLIQLQVPQGSLATVVDPAGSLVPTTAWVDPQNLQNPAPFSSISVALSRWFDLGRVIERPPAGSSPTFAFGGLDGSGFVRTEADGDLVDPAGTDLVCDYLGQIDPLTRQYRDGEEPREDFIPPSATVKVEFQGADALVPGSKEVDPASLTAWSPAPLVAQGRQFLRWRVTFDIATNGSTLGPRSPRPVVQELRVHAQY